MKAFILLIGVLLLSIHVESQNNYTRPLTNIDISGTWGSLTGNQFNLSLSGHILKYKNVKTGDEFHCKRVEPNVYKMTKRTDGDFGMNTLKVVDNNFLFVINSNNDVFLWHRLNYLNDIPINGTWTSSSGNKFEVKGLSNSIEYVNVADKNKFVFNKIRPNEYIDQDGNYIIVVDRGHIARFKYDLLSRTNWEKEYIIADKIQTYVEEHINIWQKKGEFETSAAFRQRVNDRNRKLKIDQFTKEALKELKKEYAQTIDISAFKLSDYDADHETFVVKSSELGDFVVNVPISNAPLFKQNWSKMIFEDFDFSIESDMFILAKVIISDPISGKDYHYDSQQSVTYSSNNIVYNFDPVEIELPTDRIENNQAIRDNKTLLVGMSDIDINIPQSGNMNSKTYALIIGNEDYSTYQSDLTSEANVDYAENDAVIFKKYCTSTLGIPESNIKFYINATGGQMYQAIAWINKIIEKEDGEAEVVVYYAGHGLPDEKTHIPYIIPVDVSGANIENAIKLQMLYNKLTEFPSKKVTVFMDACFTGGSRGKGLLATRGVKIKPKEDILKGNIVIFTSSSGEQSSLPYHQKQHGMFTYFLLKKIQQAKGTVSYEELYTYLKKEVDLNCVKINSKEQTPDLLVPRELGDNWKQWRFD